MAENEEFDSDFSSEEIPISEEFWDWMESYWHNNREFPESVESHFKRKADLVDGKVPASQLPSYVDDVLEFDTFKNLPSPGEKGKIYVVTDNNNQYRWSGTEYIQLNSHENLMTTNTLQSVTGRKTFYTSGGYGTNNHTLRVYANDGSNPGINFYKNGVNSGNLYYNGEQYFLTNSDNALSAYINTRGYKKDGFDDNSFLTAGGGSVLRSTYLTSNQSDAKYIPYTGATQNINLNAKNLSNVGLFEAAAFRNNSSSLNIKSLVVQNNTTVTSFGIKLKNSSTSNMMGSFTVTLFGYVGQTLSFRVSMYKYNYTWFNPTITWLHGDSSKISNIEFYKEDDANFHIKVNFATNFGSYHKSVITDVLAHENDVLHKPDTYTLSINPDNSAHTLVQTTSNTGFVRDNVGDVPKASISLGTSDLNTIITPGFYNQTANGNATVARNYPALFAGSLNVYRTTTGAVIQEYIEYVTAITYKRSFTSAWTAWNKVIDSKNGGTIAADITVSKTDGGNINIGTGGNAGSTGTPKYMNLNFLGYANNLKAKISSSDAASNTVLSPLIFYTYAQTGLQESMRIQGGGNIDFVGNLNKTTGELALQRQGVNVIRTGGTNGDSLILSGQGSTGAIYFRPQGDNVTTGQVYINNAGTIITSSHGNSSQWYDVSQAYISNVLFNRNSIISQNISNTGVTTLDAYLPNGGYITNYGVSNWGGTDAPTGASYGGFIKFGDSSGVGNNGLQFYYNNGHNSTVNHRLWFRTKNTGGTTNWFEVATREWANTQFSLTNHTHTFDSLTSKPTTLSGYGITDGMYEDNVRPSVSVDVNTYKTQGFYAMAGSFTNGASGALGWGNLLVTQSATDRFMQTYFDQSANNIYFRNGTGATTSWGTWKKILTGSDITSTNILNWNTAFGWGNHANAGYATKTFVEQSIDGISTEITDPNYSISVKNKFVTVIITQNFPKEMINWEAFYPGQSVTVINTGSNIINLDLQGKTFDKISARETFEYYVNKDKRLIKKGSYKETAIII